MTDSAPKQQKRDQGFTIFDNYFLDKVMRKAGGVEWKVICTVIRDTLGWQCQEADIPVERFEEMTGAKRSRIFEAITAACKRGAIKRPQQRAFRFRPIRRGNLYEVLRREPCLHVQEELEFLQSEPPVSEAQDQEVSQSENRILESPKIGFPQADESPIIGLCQSENRTLEPAVFNIDLNKVLNTHTHEAPRTSESGVCVDQPIDRKRYKDYARSQPRIEDPNAWATVAERTRQWDDDVIEWEEQERKRATEQEALNAIDAAREARYQAELFKKPAPLSQECSNEVSPVSEAPDETEFREKREAVERAAQQRGEEILSEIRQRSEEKKRSLG